MAFLYKFKVVARKGITLIFKEDSEFWIYVHDKGEEYYLHYDFWPNVPFIHYSAKEEYFSDIVVKKELEIQNEKCEKDSYDYFGKHATEIIENLLRRYKKRKGTDKISI